MMIKIEKVKRTYSKDISNNDEIEHD